MYIQSEKPFLLSEKKRRVISMSNPTKTTILRVFEYLKQSKAPCSINQVKDDLKISFNAARGSIEFLESVGKVKTLSNRSFTLAEVIDDAAARQAA